MKRLIFGRAHLKKMARDVTKQDEPKIFCEDCGILLKNNGKLINGCRGEKLQCGKWVYRCMDCGDKNFCEMVNSHPILKAKYISIHGVLPEEQLNIKKQMI